MFHNVPRPRMLALRGDLREDGRDAWRTSNPQLWIFDLQSPWFHLSILRPKQLHPSPSKHLDLPQGLLATLLANIHALKMSGGGLSKVSKADSPTQSSEGSYTSSIFLRDTRACSTPGRPLALALLEVSPSTITYCGELSCAHLLRHQFVTSLHPGKLSCLVPQPCPRSTGTLAIVPFGLRSRPGLCRCPQAALCCRHNGAPSG